MVYPEMGIEMDDAHDNWSIQYVWVIFCLSAFHFQVRF